MPVFAAAGSLGIGSGRLLLWQEAQLSANAIFPRFSTSASVVR